MRAGKRASKSRKIWNTRVRPGKDFAAISHRRDVAGLTFSGLEADSFKKSSRIARRPAHGRYRRALGSFLWVQDLKTIGRLIYFLSRCGVNRAIPNLYRKDYVYVHYGRLYIYHLS